jgi:hypothetical protein
MLDLAAFEQLEPRILSILTYSHPLAIAAARANSLSRPFHNGFMPAAADFPSRKGERKNTDRR